MYNPHLDPTIHAATADTRVDPIVHANILDHHGRPIQPGARGEPSQARALRRTATGALFPPDREANRQPGLRRTQTEGIASAPGYARFRDYDGNDSDGSSDDGQPSWRETMLAASNTSCRLRFPSDAGESNYRRERQDAICGESAAVPEVSDEGASIPRAESESGAVRRPRMCLTLSSTREANYYKHEREQRAASGSIPILSYSSYTRTLSDMLAEGEIQKKVEAEIEAEIEADMACVLRPLAVVKKEVEQLQKSADMLQVQLGRSRHAFRKTKSSGDVSTRVVYRTGPIRKHIREPIMTRDSRTGLPRLLKVDNKVVYYGDSPPGPEPPIRPSPGHSVQKATLFVPPPPPQPLKPQLPQHARPKAARVFDPQAGRSYIASPSDTISVSPAGSIPQAYRPTRSRMAVSRFTSNLNKPLPSLPSETPSPISSSAPAEFPFPKVPEVTVKPVSPPQEPLIQGFRNSKDEFAVPRGVRRAPILGPLGRDSPAASVSDRGHLHLHHHHDQHQSQSQEDDHDLWCEVGHESDLGEE